MFDKRDVTFNSEGVPVAGWLFLPNGATATSRVPAVTMAHGVGA